MDRDLKREYMARGSTLATIVVVHASIIFALVTHVASEWLIAVSHDGAIKDAQGMICAPTEDSASGCPWR